MKKRFYSILTIFIATIMFLGSASNIEAAATKKTTTNKPVPTTVGTTIGNSVNGSWVVKDGDNLYYISGEAWDQTNIYKADANGKNPVKINKDDYHDISNLNVSKNIIYFLKYESNPDYNYSDDTKDPYINNLYSIGSNGTTLKKLIDNIGQYYISDTKIYFVNLKDSEKLYRANLDGTKIEKLIDDKIACFNVTNDNIIYAVNEKKVDGPLFSPGIPVGSIYKTDKNGKNKSLVTKDAANCINTIGNEIYYINHSDKSKVYKVPIKGGKNKKILDFSVENINIDNGWIYFSNLSKGIDTHVGPNHNFLEKLPTLWKAKLDGTQAKELKAAYPRSINVLGNNIYYKEYFDSGTFNGETRMKMNLDGKGDTEF